MAAICAATISMMKSMPSIAKREGRPPAACDPGPLANWKEKESKPASRAKTKVVSPAISSGPLIPMADRDSPLGAAVQIDDLFCL
jgi:hypothetical protein